MKTYLTLWFNSEGESPTIVNNKIMQLGFKPIHGNYDVVYDWKEEASIEDILRLCNRVQKTLKGSKVTFTIDTI